MANAARVRVAVVVIAALAIGAACSSNNPKGGTSATATTVKSAAAIAKLLGPVKQASGVPVKIGYIYDGQSQGIDARSELVMARATAKYVNERLGGVAGRPLEIVDCADDATPAGATDCANQMIAAKVPAVLSGAPSQPAAIVKLLEPAKIPYFVYAGIDQSVLLSADGYVLTNPLGSLAASIKVANDSGVKKVAMLLIDVPAAVGPVQAIATPLFKKAGLSVSYTPVAPGTPDMTPQIQAALSKGAQQFTIIGDPAFCISALSALKTLGYTGKSVVNSQCLSADVAKNVPGGIDGVKVATNESLDAKDPQVALYEAVAAKYAPSTPPHASGNSGGYAAVVGFARATTGLTGDVTAATVQNALLTMSPQPLPLLKGQTFKCNHKTPLVPAVCSNGAVILTVDAAGKFKSAEIFDSAPYIKLG
jgi:branched-chain amino acid transport system substrate-binding protein